MWGQKRIEPDQVTAERDAFGRFRVSTPETLFDSKLSTANGATANTVTDGTILAGGFAQGNETTSQVVKSLYYLGATIAGTADTIVLCVRPLSTNEDIHAGLTIIEIA